MKIFTEEKQLQAGGLSVLTRVDVETESSGKEQERVARFDAKQNSAFTPVKKEHKRGSIKKTPKTKTTLYFVFVSSAQSFDFKFHIPCPKICTLSLELKIHSSLPPVGGASSRGSHRIDQRRRALAS